MRRSAVARPSSSGAWGLRTTPGGVPNASTATGDAGAPAPSAGAPSASTVAIHQPGHWNRPGSAIGTRPNPCSASQVRQAPTACARPSGTGSSPTGISVTDARHAANPRVTASAPPPDGSSTSITNPPRRDGAPASGASGRLVPPGVGPVPDDFFRRVPSTQADGDHGQAGPVPASATS